MQFTSFNPNRKLQLYATTGLHLNYRISERLEGYGKANLLYKNVGQESAYARTAKSIALGLNYNSNLKQEK